jgi:hypothetical protein
MKASPTMARIITQLAEKHDLRLIQPRATLQLTMQYYEPLAVEVLAPTLIHVAHIYTLPNGTTQADPGILFFTGYGPWLPVEIRQYIGGYRIYAALNPTLDDIESVWLAQQASLAAFSEMWAANIVGQGWLADGIRADSSAQSTWMES